MAEQDPIRARADEIFFSALGIETDTERDAYVIKACGSDAQLREQVDRLFAAVSESEKFFSEDAPTQITTAEVVQTLDGLDKVLEKAGRVFEEEDEEVGKQIGPYKLLRKIGEGGSGNVYVAEQSAPVRRMVAFKIIKRGMDTKSVIARFESERQALAMMDHPNIAHVYDAGKTETGRPFFVMELVSGIPITRYCNANRLGLRQRLELFVQVCHAVQHAHQKGIIHRDIKPSNVLVDLQQGEARPRVIDFGIAKAVHKGLLGDADGFTVIEPFVGTPTYMSPEQAQMGGDDLDTRSDIYSLGTLLYELLTGQTPFDAKTLAEQGIDVMRRTLMNEEPSRPSVRLKNVPVDSNSMLKTKGGAAELERALSGDLDWIVLKALEKDRARRYETVDAFSSDISRYLNFEPVTARPPSRRYQFQKMVRRNRGAVFSAAAVLAVLLIGLTVSSWLLVRERAARRRAVTAEQQAKEARKSEAQLRMEAEAREEIAMAAVLLNREQFEAAERLVENVELPVIKPSLEAGDVFLDLAEWNLERGEWNAAAAHMLKFARAVQVDKSDLTDDATRGLLCVSPTLIVAGDQEDYRKFAWEIINHFGRTQNPIAAEQVIKMCVTFPCDEALLKEVEPLGEILRETVENYRGWTSWDTYIHAWRVWALSLLEYRLGHYDEAIYWSRENLKSRDQTPTRVAMNHIILAGSLHRLGRYGEALAELQTAREIVAVGLPLGLERVVEIGDNSKGYWFDWVSAYLLLHEAEQFVQESP
ncbi:MAG: protein kinase [Pontiellaceae bacterium]|nr:protein kinase [Pontiellaceae bacterium]